MIDVRLNLDPLPSDGSGVFAAESSFANVLDVTASAFDGRATGRFRRYLIQGLRLLRNVTTFPIITMRVITHKA